MKHTEADAQPVGNLNFKLGTVGRQIVHGAVLLDSLAEDVADGVTLEALLHANLTCLVGDGRHRTSPDDILHGEVITKEHRLTRLSVDKAYERWHVKTEVVAERRVLTVVVSVIWVVVGYLGVCGKKNQALTHSAGQLGTTANISLFCEHSYCSFSLLINFQRSILDVCEHLADKPDAADAPLSQENT